MKKWLFILLLGAAVSGGLYYWWHHTGAQPLNEKLLKFAEVRQVTIRDTVSATGLIEPREIIVVSSESPGVVKRLTGAVGDTVKEGDSLAQLDDRLIQLKIEEAITGIKLAESAILQAEAAVAQADANKAAADQFLKTQRQLEKSGGFRTEREQAEAQVLTAQAGITLAKAGVEVAHAKKQAAQTALKQAELARTMTQIIVPGQGHPSSDKKTGKREFIVLERKVHEGQMVGPQAGPIFTLAGGLEVVEVHAQVAEADVNRIKIDLKAYFKVKDYNDDDVEFEGRIVKIRPLSNNIKGAVYYDTIIEVTNRRDPITKEWQLRPGMTASLDIVRVEHKNVWQVPGDALNFKLEESYQTESAHARLAEWKKRPDAKDWYALWVLDETTRQPAPVFVRINARKGEVALKDSEGNEILEWEDGRTPSAPLRIIIFAPPARAPGFFDQPANVKI